MTKNGNVELSLHVDPNLPSVMADGEQLQQVFLNLANNAQEAMPGGGRLTITAKNLNSHLEITFTDTVRTWGISLTRYSPQRLKVLVLD